MTTIYQAYTFLKRPFKQGMVIPSSRDESKWNFTFRDGNDNIYTKRDIDYDTAWEAKTSMRAFIKEQNKPIEKIAA